MSGDLDQIEGTPLVACEDCGKVTMSSGGHSCGSSTKSRPRAEVRIAEANHDPRPDDDEVGIIDGGSSASAYHETDDDGETECDMTSERELTTVDRAAARQRGYGPCRRCSPQVRDWDVDVDGGGHDGN